tara:strand:- start:2827 stop:2955 length:129 start_codon:yes stop_codon:yes gene_type:complete
MSKEALRLLLAKTKSQNARWKRISNQTVDEIISTLEILLEEK